MAALALVSTALAALPVVRAGSLTTLASCSSSVQSCSSSADSASSCCVNKPGGQFLQPQFWDTDPVTGPSNSWTIHGLWPDNCDGSFSNNCDSSREYKDITSLLQDAGKSSLVDFMQEYWQSNDESPEDFWEHEWATHGTCVSTLEPSCYSDYQTGQEVADYFQTVVDLFKTLDTYGALSDAGIVPSSSKTYTSSEILSALQKVTGKAAVISCSGSEINQIYYGFFVNGPLQNADFVPATIVGQKSNCPSSGIKYLPKNGDSPSPTTTRSPGSTPGIKLNATLLARISRQKTSQHTNKSTQTGSPSGSFSGKGFLNAIFEGSQDGCLISAGKWFTTGTCATYTASSSSSGFTLSSSKGKCGIVDGDFTCGSSVSSQTVFTAVDGKLAYKGQTTFFSSVNPTGQTQATVSTSEEKFEVSFQWEST